MMINLFKYLFSLKGRMGRKEFFTATVVYSLITGFIMTVWSLKYQTLEEIIAAMPLLQTVSLFMTIPVLAFTIRRLHDMNKSASNCIYSLIPIYNIIWIYRLYFGHSVNVGNKYGIEDKPPVPPKFD